MQPRGGVLARMELDVAVGLLESHEHGCGGESSWPYQCGTVLTVQLTAASDAVTQPVSLVTVTNETPEGGIADKKGFGGLATSWPPYPLGSEEAVLPNGLVIQ